MKKKIKKHPIEIAHEREVRRLKKLMKAATKKILSTPNGAREFLVKLGTHTPTGRLTKAYRSEVPVQKKKTSKKKPK